MSGARNIVVTTKVTITVLGTVKVIQSVSAR